MAVTIVGTLEMIYDSGGDTVSEAVHVDFASPTDVPLPLHESLNFPDRTPPVDVRVALEAHLADEDAHGFTDVTRVPVSRDGAMAEWTAVRDGITRALVLWDAVPLRQEGIDWGVTAVGDERLEWAYQSIPIGDGAEATGEASIAIGYNAKSTEESSTAMGHDASAAGKQSLAVGRNSNAGADYSTTIGVDAQAIGNSSFAAGHGTAANGTNSVAVGRGAEAIGDQSVAVGMLAEAAFSSTSVGQSAMAGGVLSTAIGQNAAATGYQSSAFGISAAASQEKSVAVGSLSTVHSEGGTAMGASATVYTGSERSVAIGNNVMIMNTPDTTVIATKSLQLKPHPDASTLASELVLYDASGNPHVIRATVGQTHSYSENTSPAAESLIGVGTYSTAGVLRSGTLQSFIPEITTGLWDVDIEAHALVYRSVATGGVYLFVGNGTASYQQALGRLSPQTHAYTLNVNVSPSIVGSGTGLKAVGPGQVIDMRYTGFGTAGTTHVVNHGWKITARRVG